MANIRVVPRSLTYAYTQRQGDFAPSLVGNQLTDGASLFTFGNFNITTNLQARRVQNFTLGGEWSNYYNLDNLNLTQEQSEVLSTTNEMLVKLNFNPRNISRYAYFGSLREIIKTTIESIISKWKGSIYLNPRNSGSGSQNTVLSFNYNSGTDISEFLIPVSLMSNPYNLDITNNTDFGNIPQGEIYNLSRDYNKYVIWNGTDSFKVVGFTGLTTVIFTATTIPFNYVRVKTKGNPFPNLTYTFAPLTYHLKPNDEEVEMFFYQLTDFENLLLNRLTIPAYTSTFSVPRDFAAIATSDESFTWPVSDGYNLDNGSFSDQGNQNRPYQNYVSNIITMAENFDKFKTDLVARRFVSESIHEYDTNSGYVGVDAIIYGKKVNKLLRIYGREFDEVKKYIDGISFANVVTYNKLDNTSDELIKIMAKTLGFDVLLTVGTDNFNLIQQIQPSYTSPFPGYSVSLSSKELDIELWRRLVINAWWLFKSKGTRKVIEFFFNLFKIPQCMITLDEYVYLAESRLDYDKVTAQLLQIYNLADPTANFPDLLIQSVVVNGATIPSPEAAPMDELGFPRVPIENNDNYFQAGGFWYNGGSTSINGNNPHIGPYDYGKKYFDQFKCFVTNFSNLLTGTSTSIVYKNYFNNYNEGTFIFDQNGLPVPFYSTQYGTTLNSTSENVSIISAGLTQVGTQNGPSYARPEGDEYSMKIKFIAGANNICGVPCLYDLVFGEDGIVYTDNNNTLLTDQNCCKTYWLPTPQNNPTERCPTTGNLFINTNGVVYDTTTGKPLPQSCCFKDILGFNVVWNGSECLDASTVVVTGGGGVSNTTTNIAQRTYNPIDLFQTSTTNNTTQGVQPASYTCYWCPPESYIQKVCNADEYLAILNQQQINQYATSLGWTPPNNVSANVILYNIYASFFTQYGCLILDSSDEMIKDRTCCTMRGGNLIELNGNKYCVAQNTDPCANPQISSNTHVWVKSDGTLLPQDCCNKTGQYWISPINTSTNISLTMSGSSTSSSFLDLPGFSFANSLSYCSSCPKNLIEIPVPSGSVIMEKVTNGVNANLSQKCCLDYGFNYDSVNNVCRKITNISFNLGNLFGSVTTGTVTGGTGTSGTGTTGTGGTSTVCPPSVNVALYSTGFPNNTAITDLNNKTLDQYCCQQAGGYYGYFGNTSVTGAYVDQLGNVSGPVNTTSLNLTVPQTPQNAKICFRCPPRSDSGYSLNPVLVGTINKTEVLYNGNTISYFCCSYYTQNSIGWSYQNGKCYL